MYKTDMHTEDPVGQALKRIAGATEAVRLAESYVVSTKAQMKEQYRLAVEKAQEGVREAKRELALARQERAMLLHD